MFAWYDFWIGVFVDRPKRRVNLAQQREAAAALDQLLGEVLG